MFDTRMELHILEYEVRMASIAKEAIANYTYYLIKISLLPQSRYVYQITDTDSGKIIAISIQKH